MCVWMEAWIFLLCPKEIDAYLGRNLDVAWGDPNMTATSNRLSAQHIELPSLNISWPIKTYELFYNR